MSKSEQSGSKLPVIHWKYKVKQDQWSETHIRTSPGGLTVMSLERQHCMGDTDYYFHYRDGANGVRIVLIDPYFSPKSLAMSRDGRTLYFLQVRLGYEPNIDCSYDLSTGEKSEGVKAPRNVFKMKALFPAFIYR